ncbi:hypothetical protein VTK26DRAFT_3847 [Humicola hyalothermophila]
MEVSGTSITFTDHRPTIHPITDLTKSRMSICLKMRTKGVRDWRLRTTPGPMTRMLLMATSTRFTCGIRTGTLVW